MDAKGGHRIGWCWFILVGDKYAPTHSTKASKLTSPDDIGLTATVKKIWNA